MALWYSVTLIECEKVLRKLAEDNVLEAIFNGDMNNENRKDLGRVQAKLPIGKQFPGEGMLTQMIPFGERAVLRLRAVLANFDEARAQELHYDNPPPSYKSDQNMDEVVKTMSGAVIISVRPTSLIVYPGSHRLGCGHKFRPDSSWLHACICKCSTCRFWDNQ